jgi:hypothetical protein
VGHRIFGSVGNPPSDGEEGSGSAAAEAPLSLPAEATAEAPPAAAAVAQLETLKARVLQAEMRGNALEAELADVAKRLARSDAALVSRRAERESAEEELAAARQELKAVRTKLATRADDVDRSQETSLRRELEAARAQTKDLEQQLRVFEDWVIRLTQERRRNEAAGTPAGAPRASAPRFTEDESAQLAAVRAELKSERAALKSLREKHQKLASLFADAKTKLGLRIAAEKQAAAVMRHRLKESTAQLEKMRQRMGALGINVSLLEKSSAWRAMRVVLDTEAGLRRSYRRLGRVIRKEPSQELVHAELIVQSKYFDAGWYKNRYLDGAGTELEAALHYLRVGASEGHDPGPSFSSSYYLEQHADVANAGFNPLLHYVRFGEREGRSIVGGDGEQPLARSTRAAVVQQPRNEFEAPLDALIPVRYPLAALPAEASEADAEVVADGALPLQLSGVALGWLRAVGALPLDSITAFSVLSGVDPGQALQLDEQSGRSPSETSEMSAARAAGLVLALGAEASCELVDAWFLNDCDIRARLRATQGRPGAKRVLRCYQYDPTGERGLALLGEWPVPLGELGLVDIATQNPYCPVLFVLSTQAGEILSLSLLPFPSLCRGGTHYGELLAVAPDLPYLEAIRSVSGTLLESRLRASVSPVRVEVDLTTATGAERIFSLHLRQWWLRSLKVEVASRGPVSSTEGPLSYLEEALCTPASSDAEPSLVLSLSADAVPSLTSLIAPALAHHAARPGAFVIADTLDAAPKWLVSPPDVQPSLATLQPQGRGFPTSTSPTSIDDTLAGQAASAQAFPLAIRFCDLSDPAPARLMMPLALEKRGPLLPETHSVADARVSVLYHPSGAPGTPGNLQVFLESLELQKRVSIEEVVVLLPEVDYQALTAAREILERHVGARGRVVAYPSGSGYGTRLNDAVASARGELLLIADGGIILHDPRTLATLAGLAQHEKTAAASCMLLQCTERAAAPVRFHSAGYFPVADLGSEEQQGGQLRTAPHPGRLPPATWPVAATSSKLLMVRAETWRQIGGFGAAGFGRMECDFEYGSRTTMQGYFHFCTSVISATMLEDAPPADARAAVVAQTTGRTHRLEADEFAAATRVGTLLRSLVT